MNLRSPGYALSLLAESTTAALFCTEAVSEPGGSPEDVALLASRALLSEIRSGGCVDRHHQCLVLLMMVLGSEDVGRCRMGEPTTRTYVNNYSSMQRTLHHLLQGAVSSGYQELFWDIIQDCTSQPLRLVLFRPLVFMLRSRLRQCQPDTRIDVMPFVPTCIALAHRYMRATLPKSPPPFPPPIAVSHCCSKGHPTSNRAQSSSV